MLPKPRPPCCYTGPISGATPAGLAAFKALGRGYAENVPGSRGVRDTEHRVDIDVVLLPLPMLVELKLASGMTAPHWLKDLADVQELIRIQRLPQAFALEVDAFVRDKYLEFWQAIQD